MYQFKVYREGGVLRVDADIDDGAVSFALTMKDVDKLQFLAYSLRAENKNQIEFIRNRDSGKVEYVTYDRYLYRRV